jgi:hypothetical protein
MEISPDDEFAPVAPITLFPRADTPSQEKCAEDFREAISARAVRKGANNFRAE